MSPPKRQVVHRSPAHTVRLLCLPHLQATPIEADSSLERDFVHTAALFPWIRSIEDQPFRLDLKAGSYTPDFLLEFQDGSKAVVEVKPEVLLAGLEEKYAEAAELLKEQGMLFVLALDKFIQFENRAARALKIRRYAKGVTDEASSSKVMSLLRQASTLTVQQLMDHGVSICTMSQLICRRVMETGPALRLDRDAVVSLPKKSMEGGSHAIHFAAWLAA